MPSKLASDVACIVEVGSNDRDVGASSDWALSGLYVEEEGWLVVIVLGAVIGIVLCIQCELDSCLPPVVGWWSDASSSSRVEDLSANSDVQSLECTVCGV